MPSEITLVASCQACHYRMSPAETSTARSLGRGDGLTLCSHCRLNHSPDDGELRVEPLPRGQFAVRDVDGELLSVHGTRRNAERELSRLLALERQYDRALATLRNSVKRAVLAEALGHGREERRGGTR